VRIRGGFLTNPFFSIVVSYRRDAVIDERFEACLESVASQSCDDYELLLLHDGELPSPISEKAQKIIDDNGFELLETSKWYKDWGHSLRDIGIKMAKGDYVLLLNGDNLLYDCLGDIKKFIIGSGKRPFYTFGVLMVGVKVTMDLGTHKAITTTKNPSDKFFLSGVPKPGSIDVLNGVASKKAWDEVGGWYRNDMNSDGFIYADLNDRFGVVMNPKIIVGEHW
jgi:glycosyltransferase involved in cell wall biosynthesis